MVLNHKVDFAVIFSVHNANANGDPLNGNRPRQSFDGFGEMSREAINRKIRNRLQDMGGAIFVQSDDRVDDGFRSLKERMENHPELGKLLKVKNFSSEEFKKIACQVWDDVRYFGQVFAFKGKNKSEDGISERVRGPVTIRIARSVDPITINSMQITKSVNSEPGEKMSSDRMGMKHLVDFGIYVVYGSINTQLAEKTGFTLDDAEKLKQALVTLFENDESSARPAGSMRVQKVYWWEHPTKMGLCSSAKVHELLTIQSSVEQPMSLDQYLIQLNQMEGLNVEVLDGF